jgi:hypothetical protein
MTAAQFCYLPLELRRAIYDVSDFSSLRHVNKQLYEEVSPLYWKQFVLKIECWGIDGLDEHNFSSPDPWAQDPDLWGRIKRRNNLLGRTDVSHLFYYRQFYPFEKGSRRPRNYAWLCQMPLLARRYVRHVQLFGKL